MRATMENQGYFCTLARCRPSWIDRKWVFTIPRYPGSHGTRACQISRQSENVRMSC